MIVNLVGRIGAGKSTFAQWFLKKHPNWYYGDIVECRHIARKLHPQGKPAVIERRAFQLLRHTCFAPGHCIIESTGLPYILRQLWQSVGGRYIYTVMIDTPLEICRENVREREVLEGFLSDEEGLSYEEQMQQQLPANIILCKKGDESKEELEKLYQELETEILIAGAICG